jgi:cell wall-associated NlpC family hydrolase
MIEYLKIPYLDYGRTMTGCDCWGLVRIIRHSIRGDLLPSFGWVSPDDKPGLTKSAGEVIDDFQFTERSKQDVKPGAIATCWRGVLCLHVGIVDMIEGRLAVIETGKTIGVRWRFIDDFEARYTMVKYYDNN